MNWYPTRVLPSLALVLTCGSQAYAQATAKPAAPPPASMKATEAAREHATSLAQLLQGRLSGVIVSPAPDGGIIVRIGGPTSFYGNQALKDPSQTAIYGVRGANGVIVIKTKGSH